MSAAPKLDSFPSEVFDAAVLRDFDDASRDAIARAGRVRDVEAGTVLYRNADPSDSFFVVIGGAVELFAVRRGEETSTRIRTARRGDTLGEEATLPGLTRRATAKASEPSTVAEIPIAVFRRATGRAGSSRAAEREKRYLHRAVTRDVVFGSALGGGLGADDIDMLLDAAELRRLRRGAHIYDTGDKAEAFYLLAEGLVQIQSERNSQVSVLAYIARGDFFGDEEILAGQARCADAVASGDAWCVRLPAKAFRQVADRNPGLLAGLRRVASAQRERQSDLIADAGTTQHVFQDLYRMQVARSLLVIDQDACVRCGHCAWSCSEVHGASRLVRRGDNVLVALGKQSHGAVPTTLSLPNTCQHCRNAACMVDCPTGAIGRDLRGEVFIREALCTGCGACSKACPWENISMAPRSGAPKLSPTVAVKCDLCRDYQSPACVQACPTEAIFRIDPERDIAEVRQLVGAASEGTQNASPGDQSRDSLSAAFVAIASAIAIALPVGGVANAMQRAGTWQPGRGVGLLAALLAGMCIALLTAYLVPKRMVRLWMRRRPRGTPALRELGAGEGAPRSRIKPQLVAHIILGLAACSLVMAHAGVRVPASPAGALNLGFWVAALTGVLGGILYVGVPRRLSRLERRSALPEDLRGQRRLLLDRLYRESSGRQELVKAIVSRVLVPYSRALIGPVALAMSGRTLAEERARLRTRIDVMLESRGQDRLEGLDALIKIVVDLRATPGRRAYTLALRGWLPVHIVAVAMTLALFAVHLLMVVLW